MSIFYLFQLKHVKKIHTLKPSMCCLKIAKRKRKKRQLTSKIKRKEKDFLHRLVCRVVAEKTQTEWPASEIPWPL